MNHPPKTGTLTVPGATLHYEVRGTGPVLLLIPGGGADASAYDGLGDALADRYTVVSYDPRGKSRSVLEGPVTDQRVEEQSEDAYRLLRHVLPDGERAFVFGSSSGAIIALDLLTRHPERVHVVVPHEPPVVEILPDAAEHRAFFAAVPAAYERGGLAAAVAVMNEGVGEQGGELPDPDRLPAHLAEPFRRVLANMPFFLVRELRQYTAYVPDEEALADMVRARPGQLVLAGGRDSRGKLLYRPGAALAERLGAEFVEFPGGHTGYRGHPNAFAPVLEKLFSSTGSRPA